MTFQDLPPNPRELPLDTPTLREDFVDLVVTQQDRYYGCIGFLFCTKEHICRAPVIVKEIGRPDAEQLRILLLKLVAQIVPDAIVVALGRPGRAPVTPHDHVSHHVVLDVCRELGIDLLGTVVASEFSVTELPVPMEIAS